MHVKTFSSILLNLLRLYTSEATVSVVSWSEFLATDTEVSGSISGAIRFCE